MRIGEIVRLTRHAARRASEIGSYGSPISVGIATGMIWNRRDALYAPVGFSMLFLGVTWGSGHPHSLLDYVHQIHENAKLLRCGISRTLQTVYQGWGIVRKNRYVAGKSVAAPQEGATDEPATEVRPTPLVLPTTIDHAVMPTQSVTGTGVAVAAHPSTAEPHPVQEGTEGTREGDDEESPQQRREAAELALTG